MKKIFDLNHQYKLYLERMALHENRMHLTQKIETKRAFMGGCAQMIFLFRDDIGDIENEMEAVETMESLKNQAIQYFISENNKQNN